MDLPRIFTDFNQYSIPTFHFVGVSSNVDTRSWAIIFSSPCAKLLSSLFGFRLNGRMVTKHIGIIKINDVYDRTKSTSVIGSCIFSVLNYRAHKSNLLLNSTGNHFTYMGCMELDEAFWMKGVEVNSLKCFVIIVSSQGFLTCIDMDGCSYVSCHVSTWMREI